MEAFALSYPGRASTTFLILGMWKHLSMDQSAKSQSGFNIAILPCPSTNLQDQKKIGMRPHVPANRTTCEVWRSGSPMIGQSAAAITGGMTSYAHRVGTVGAICRGEQRHSAFLRRPCIAHYQSTACDYHHIPLCGLFFFSSMITNERP